jgi:hypothetical protein
MGGIDTPKENIENLLCVKQMHFPKQPIDWVYLLDKFSKPSHSLFVWTTVSRKNRISCHVLHVNKCAGSCLKSLA